MGCICLGIHLDSIFWSSYLCIYPFAKITLPDNWSFVLGLKIEYCDSANFILHLKNCFGILVLWPFH